MDDFKLTFYTRRWNNDVTLNVRKTAGGWNISHIAINGDANEEGAPILESNLRQDYVEFPVGLGKFMAFIWQKLHNEEIEFDRAQEMINELRAWISTCESSQPNWNEWNC
jgi:hypothetical protein